MDEKNLRFRNTAFLLIGAGLFLLLQHMLGFFNLAAALLILLGVYRIRTIGDRRGYLIAGIGAIVLISNHFNVLITVVLISLGLFYMQSRKFRHEAVFSRSHKLVASLKWDQQSWVMRSMWLWSLVGELRFDFSQAIPEQAETVIMLQGMIGDVDIHVPSDDLGVWVTASVVFGQIEVPGDKEAGVLNKLEWRSPNYETCEHKVKVIISYLVGDVDIALWDA